MDLEKIKNVFPLEKDIPKEFAIQEFIEQREYLIDGEIRYWAGAVQEIQSPVCIVDKSGKVSRKAIGSTPLLTSKESTEALEAAVKAYNLGHGYWPTLTVNERISHMERFVSKMKEKRHEIVKLLMWEIGKSLKDAEKEFDRTVVYIIDTINALKDSDRDASRFEMQEGVLAQIRRVPLGVAVCMGPFNYPLNETFSTMMPALLMGNTVVFKPAKYGVLLIQPLLEAFKECFPKGVINVIFGSGRAIIGPLMETGKVDLFAFIGTNTGANDLKKLHPKPHRLKAVLGLDAKNPGIVLADADLQVAVKESILGSLSYNGQRCTALKILFVHKNIVDKFIEAFTEELGKLKIGMPWDEGVSLTPLPEPGKTDYLKGLVDDALQHGAKVMNPNGGVVNETFFYPAVMYPVNEHMRLYKEEQFGPVIPIVPFSDVETPIRYIVNSSFGQQASIFGKDSKQIAYLIDALVNQVSRININAQCQRGPDTMPFNGRKDSAEGTLSVKDALRAFSIRALVATKDSEDNKEIIRQIIRERQSSFLTTDYIL
ncbi:MAG TPA: NADP-dependent glyceraldehyde-3-phosphate dehydrogenase [Microscillaceae bacterium]|jgi:glyceraldehyde-3-phosphate dehydrogenase (NADP+)|nr:NADP-dependent glyceraldehyde-3-phosphate dehydrogenase [Microscillaceae bacterium]